MNWESTAVDLDYLCKCLRVPKGSITRDQLDTLEKVVAARVITDAFRPIDRDDSEIPVKAALSNAESWVRTAYKAGQEAGESSERRDWVRKMRNLYGFREGE